MKEVEREKVKRELRCIILFRSTLRLVEKLKADFCASNVVHTHV